MTNINIREIYDKKCGQYAFYHLGKEAQEAIKDMLNIVIERCAKQAQLTDFAHEFMQEGAGEAIDKESILSVKKALSFEKEAENQVWVESIGTLTKAYGQVGYNTAEIGHPVFETNDRYFIVLTRDKGADLKVYFYKETLKYYINFYDKDTAKS